MLLVRAYGGTAAQNVPNPPANSTAPTVPVALSPVEEVDLCTFRVWQSVCHHDGTMAANDIDEYEVDDDGDNVADSVVDAPAANALSTPTLRNIGSVSSPSATRVNSVDWTIASPGVNGFETAAADQLAFLDFGSHVAGNVLSATIGTFTSPDSGSFPGSYAAGGVIVRESTAQGSKFIAVFWTLDGWYFCKYRPTTNGAVQTLTPVLGAKGTPHLEDMTGGQWRAYYQVPNGVPSLIGTVSGLTLTGAERGLFVYSLTANPATCTFSQIAFRSATVIDLEVPGTSSTTVKFRAKDSVGNYSAWSTAQTGAGQSSSTEFRKWHPGHWAQARSEPHHSGGTGSGVPGNAATGIAARLATVQSLASEPTVQGVRWFYNIAQLYPTEGDFSTAINIIQQDLDNCEANGKMMMFWFKTGVYATGLSDTVHILELVPAWMLNAGHIAVGVPNETVEIAFYRPATATMWGTFIAALLDEFDDHPAFEGLTITWEIATQFGGSGWETGYETMHDLIEPHLVHSNVWIGASFPPTQSNANGMVASAVAHGFGYGNNDTISNLESSEGYFLTYGDTAFINGGYLGQVSLLNAVETSELGYNSVGRNGGYTPSDLGAYMQSRGCSHGVWDMNEETGTAEQRWSTGILPWIRANPNLSATCPTAYNGLCETT